MNRKAPPQKYKQQHASRPLVAERTIKRPGRYSWSRSQGASFLLFQCSRWRPLIFVVKRTDGTFNMIIALPLVFFYFTGFLCSCFGLVIKSAHFSYSHQSLILELVFIFYMDFALCAQNSARSYEIFCCLCCRSSAGHRAVVVAAVCAVYT